MSITIKQDSRSGLPTLQELQDDVSAKTQATMEADRAFKAEQVAGEKGRKFDLLSAARHDELQAMQAHRERLHVISAAPIDLYALGQVEVDNPGIDLLDALDEVYRAPRVHTYDEPVTDEELAAIFAGSDEKQAAQEWQDHMAEEVEHGNLVEEDPWGSDPRVREAAIAGELESDAADFAEKNV